MNTCQVQDPNQLRFCDMADYDIPFQTQIKLNGSYNLPWRVQVSGTFQSYPGDARNTSYDTTIAAVDPSLRENWIVNNAIFSALTGQTLTQSQITIPLNEPGQKFLERQNQLDIRFKRMFTVRGLTLEAQADAYNALNTGVVLTENQTFGTALGRPTSILQGRLWRLGMQARW